jgi:signal peptidase I
MSYQDWFIIFIAVQFIHGLGTWKLYIKAGEKPWAAFVPVYNAIVLMRIINRKWWLVFLLFFPVINVMMFIILWNTSMAMINMMILMLMDSILLKVQIFK